MTSDLVSVVTSVDSFDSSDESVDLMVASLLSYSWKNCPSVVVPSKLLSPVPMGSSVPTGSSGNSSVGTSPPSTNICSFYFVTFMMVWFIFSCRPTTLALNI